MNASIQKVFSQLSAIDAPSLGERAIADHIKLLFAKIGVELLEDDSAQDTGSTAGNLYGYVSGSGKGKEKEPLLLSAHMDTVMPAYGKRALFHEDGTITSDGITVLGADDLSGVTAIYEALRYLREHQIEHRDIEVLFTTGEELYCKGAKAFNYAVVKAKQALVLDLSGPIGGAAYAAPTILSFVVTIQGKAAHAGFCPEEGVHAIRVASEGIAKLPMGHIDGETTGNIGQIHGGSGVNIVPETAKICGEIRSLSHEKALALADEYQKIFAETAAKYRAKIVWEQQVDIRAYEANRNGDLVRLYEQACSKVGITPKLQKTFGGSDNNVFAEHGMEGLVIATSMNNVHSCGEYANVNEIAQVAKILMEATAM